MANNSANINKTNNHLSSYLTEQKKKRPCHIYAIGNPGPGLEQTQKWGWVKSVKVVKPVFNDHSRESQSMVKVWSLNTGDLLKQNVLQWLLKMYPFSTSFCLIQVVFL